MKLPPPAKRLVMGDKLLDCGLLCANIMLFKLGFLALGIDDVQIICQAVIVSLGGQSGRLAGARKCAIEIL